MSDDQHTEECYIWNRREFLKMGAGAAAALTVASIPNLSWASATIGKPKPTTLDRCLAMSPLEMAQKSEIVQNAYHFLIATAREIQDGSLRETVLSILDNPAPTVAARFAGDSEKQAIRQSLVDGKLLDDKVGIDSLFPPLENPQKATQSWLSAPGSGYGSHHSYPGGLSTHTAANVKIATSIHRTYGEVYGYQPRRDIVIAAQTLHDLHKPWVFQWRKNGASLPEAVLAGQGAHHTLSVAESIYRGLPAEVIVAQACAHGHPGTPKDEADVVGWIKAAAIIAGKDPVSLGLLSPAGDTLPTPHKQEGYITHLGDHDFVLTVPAAQKSIAVLQKIARQEYGMSEEDLKTANFYQFRNYICSQVSMMAVHARLSADGEPAVVELVHSLVTH